MSKAHTLNGWNITRDGSREVWVQHNNEFVARFKYANAGKSATHFIKFLTANFTPEEYFALKQTKAPVCVLETKGYVCYNVALYNAERARKNV